MEFLAPQFLYGLLAISIPIIIHLFNFRKTKRIYFSNNRFIQSISESTSTNIKLKNYLILLARILFIAFLVLAFAQPFIHSEKKGFVHDYVSIYLDNSMSMSNEMQEGVRAFDVGIDYVVSILDLYPNGTKFKLLTNDFSPFSNRYKDKKKILEKITELRLSSVTRNLSEIVKRLQLGNGQTKIDEDVFLISDFQKSTHGDLGVLVEDTVNKYHIMPLSYPSERNVYIDSVFFSNPLMVKGLKNQLNALVRYHGEGTYEDFILKLFVNDIQVATAGATLKPFENNILTFDLNYAFDRINNCKLSFEEFPTSFDNDYFFKINMASRLKVLEISSGDSTQFIRNVYGNSEIFDFVQVDVDHFDYSQIQNADLVIVNRVEVLRKSLENALLDYYIQGGHLAIIPSKTPDISSWQHLVPGRIGAIEIDVGTKFRVNKPDLKIPFFANIFEDNEGNIDMPFVRPVLKIDGGRDLLKDQEQNAVIATFSENGKMYVFAMPISKENTNLHRHALFVPIMYKMAVMSKNIDVKLAYYLDESFSKFKLDSILSEDIYVLKRGGQEVIPSQRVYENELIIELPKHMLEAGFYELMYKDQKVDYLPINYSTDESILDQLSVEEIEEVTNESDNKVIFSFDSSSAFKDNVNALYTGLPLWRYALLISLFFLLTEILLIRFLKK